MSTAVGVSPSFANLQLVPSSPEYGVSGSLMRFF